MKSDLERNLDLSSVSESAREALKDNARWAGDALSSGADRVGRTAQRWGEQAGETANDLAEASLETARTVARRAGEQPLLTLLAGAALGYVINSWLHHGDSHGPH